MFSASTKEAATITKDMAANDIKNSANNIERAARDKSRDVVEDLSGYANEAGQRVRHFIDSANDDLHRAGDKVTGEIRSNPIRSSALALGLGFVLGALFRR